MARGAIGSIYPDRPDSLHHFTAARAAHHSPSDAPPAAQYFGDAGAAYLERYDADVSLFAQVAVKARRHAAANPAAVFRDPFTVEEVLASPHVYGPLTRLQCCPPTCGAAAAVVVSEGFAKRHGLRAEVRILAQSMASDTPSSFTTDLPHLVGTGLTATAANATATTRAFFRLPAAAG